MTQSPSKVGQIAKMYNQPRIATIQHIVLKFRCDHASFREEKRAQILVGNGTKESKKNNMW